MRSHKGAVLIVVLGVLAILALLATTFATLQATERRVARNYLDAVRAKLLAQSGVQDAEARLRELFPSHPFDTAVPARPRPWKFWGPDKTETREPTPADRVEEAVNPSFALEKESPQDPTDPRVEPRTIRIAGKERGLSGAMASGTYAAFGDHYALKVSDLSGRIYVNDGLDGGPQGSVTQNLKRLLNVLGEVLSVKELGEKIVSRRPAAGYRQPQDLLRAVDYDEAAYARFRDFVTVHAWVDPNVANPVPLSAGLEPAYPVRYYRGTPPVFRMGSSLDAGAQEAVPPGGLMTCPSAPPDDPAIRVYGLDTLNPQWIEVVSRAPVNVNAASREVLVALLTDLRGFFLADRRRNNPRWKGDLYLSFKQQNTFSPDRTEGDEIGFLMETVPIVGPGGTATDGISAFVLADEILACRNRRASANFNYATVPWAGPFRTWRQFYQFVDTLALPKAEGGAGVLDDTRPLHKDYEEEVDDPSGYGALVESPLQRRHAVRAIADVLKANFNPNLHLNELNPDENLFLRVDKTDLIVNSTEFTFLPTGYFEVESLGRVVRPLDPGVADAARGDNELLAQAKVTAVLKLYDLYRETNHRQFYAGTISPRTGSFDTNSNVSLEVGPEPDNGTFPGNLGAPGTPDNEWAGYVALPTVGSVWHDYPPPPPPAPPTTRPPPPAPPRPGPPPPPPPPEPEPDTSAPRPPSPYANAPVEIAFRPLEPSAGAVPPPPPPPPRPLPPPSKPKNTLQRTLDMPPNRHLGSAFHVHYTLDMDACHHALNRQEIAARVLPDETVSNHPDHVNGAPLSYAGPYDPTKGPPNTHRLAKSFRRPLSESGAPTACSLEPYAPSDLRIDGAYVERHAAPAYYTQMGRRQLWDFSEDLARGTVSFWFKPSFFPELTGKVRTLWDMSRYHHPCPSNVFVWPFAMWFFPGHYNASVSEAGGPKYFHNNMGQFHPCSLVWGSKQWHSDEIVTIDGQAGVRAHQFGKITTSLNHVGHDDEAIKPSPLRAHRWIHVAFSWNLRGANDPSGQLSKLHVNGTTLYTQFGYTSMTSWPERYDRMNGFEKHAGGEFNQMRIGGTSRICNAAISAGVSGAYRGNHSSDVTIDELYVWRYATRPISLWQRGRYYKPLDANAGEGRFESSPLTFASKARRTLPPPAGGGAGATAAAAPPRVRVLGMAWTWYGEAADPETGRAALYDYNSPRGTATTDVQPRVLLGLRDGDVTFGPFEDDGYSPVRTADGATPFLRDLEQARYFAQFRLQGADLSTILLATPVLDDVTLYVSDEEEGAVLSYFFDGRSF